MILVYHCYVFQRLNNALTTLYRSIFPYKIENGTNGYERWILDQRTSTGFRLATEESDGQLLTDFKALCIKAGLKKEARLIIYDNEYPRASTLYTGAVLISTGLLKSRTPDELKFILGHEITHLLQRKTDIISNLVAALAPIATGIMVAGQMVDKNKNSENSTIIALKSVGIFSIIHYIADKLIQIPMQAFNRVLEYDADRGSLILTNDLNAAKSDLEKHEIYINEIASHANSIVEGQNEVNVTNRKHSSKFSSTPSIKSFLERAYRNHPTTENRIKHLENTQKKIDSGELRNTHPSRFF